MLLVDPTCIARGDKRSLGIFLFRLVPDATTVQYTSTSFMQ